MSKKLIRNFRYDVFRQGDTGFTHGRRFRSVVIRYALAWDNTKAGRAAARKAVHDVNYPNHSFNVQDVFGQKYPYEAGPRGYEEGSFQDYRTKNDSIVAVYRWRGFDDDEVRAHGAKVLELWTRRGKEHRKYDLGGAVSSTKLGRLLLPWAKPSADELYCSEGSLHLHVICGILGEVLPVDVDPHIVVRLIEAYPDKMPRSANPLDLMLWMASHRDFAKVDGFIL